MVDAQIAVIQDKEGIVKVQMDEVAAAVDKNKDKILQKLLDVKEALG